MAALLVCITSTHDTLTRHTGINQAATKQDTARSSVSCTHSRAEIRQHQKKQNTSRSSVFCLKRIVAAHLLCITSAHDTLARHARINQVATKQNTARSSVSCTHRRAEMRQHRNKQNTARSSVFCHKMDCGSTLIMYH